MRKTAAWGILVGVCACAVLPPTLPPNTSVEAVLRRSEKVAALLDDEERARLEHQGRSPASKLRPRLQQPLRKLQLNSRFGSRNGKKHLGVDLQASVGTPVYASDAGVVVYVGVNIDGYGETVILRHVGGISTLYAHCSSLHVEEGERVTKGQAIAYSGDTGNASGPHLHFEVRSGTKPIDPAAWILPQRKPSSKKSL